MNTGTKRLSDYPDVIKHLPEAEIQIGGVKAWILQSENSQLVFFDFEADAKVPEHSHSYPQWGMVIEGKMELTISGEPRICERGDDYLIPTDTKHRVKFFERTRVMDFFSEKNRYYPKKCFLLAQPPERFILAKTVAMLRRVSGILHPFRLNKTRCWRLKRTKFDSRDLTSTALFAALYVVINVVQTITVGNPTIYGPIQLRVADFMIALTVLFGWPMVGGVTLGCFLTNAYYFLGAPDVILGPIANFAAAYVVLLLRKHRFAASVAGALPIGFIVGGELWFFFSFTPATDLLGALPAWAAMILSITISSLIAVTVIGYTVLSVLSRPRILEPLKSRGLKVIDVK